MAAVKAFVQRMTTSRKGPTKYEHFATLENSDGKKMTMYMRHDPEEALFSAMELAKFLGIPCDPLVIDGVEVQLSSVSKMMLED